MSAGVHPDFPISISAAEAEAGFVLVRIANPRASEPGSVPELYAAVRPIDNHNRLLKVRTASGGVGYVHRQRDPASVYGATGELRWQTVSPPFDSIQEALRASKRTG